MIAPKKVAEGTWTREKEKWDHTRILRVSPVLGSQAKRIRALNTSADLYVINRENVCWLVDYYRNSWPFDMVVVDESSSFKSHSAKRFKALASVSGKIDRMVELTGTPSPNGLDDLWSQIYLLDGGERLGRRYTQFRERYFQPDRRGADGMVYSYAAKPGTEQSILDRISDICISMKAEDYLQLPDITYHEIPVELDAKAEKAYRELERKMVLELPEEEEISVTSAAALSNKLLQLANGAVYDEGRSVHEIHGCKIEAFLELVESLHGSKSQTTEKAPAQKKQADTADVFPMLMERAVEAGMQRRDFIQSCNRIQKRLDIEIGVAALIVLRDAGADVSPYLDAVYDSVKGS